MKLTVIIPVYNEEKTVSKVVEKLMKVKTVQIKEIIIINDGSTDGTGKIINGLKYKKLKKIYKPWNEGKGAAIRDALKIMTGDIGIIQDADLEYNPEEFPLLMDPILNGQADVVYGSRLETTRPHRVLYFWHFVGNKILTLITNVVTNINLTDMETCYKAFTREVAGKLDLQEKRFGFDPEFTIKAVKMGARIYEVGISYSGRSYAEGKKINWRDGLGILWCTVKYGLI